MISSQLASGSPHWTVELSSVLWLGPSEFQKVTRAAKCWQSPVDLAMSLPSCRSMESYKTCTPPIHAPLLEKRGE